MPDYQALYNRMLAVALDACRHIDEKNYGLASCVLRNAVTQGIHLCDEDAHSYGPHSSFAWLQRHPQIDSEKE